MFSLFSIIYAAAVNSADFKKEGTVGILIQTVFFSYICLQTEISEDENNKKNRLWLSCWRCLGLLTRGWGLPAEFNAARLHGYRRNTSSSTHNILILLSSPPSLPLPWYVTELIVKMEYTCIIRAGPFPFCVLIKQARPLLLDWWTLVRSSLKRQAGHQKQHIHNVAGMQHTGLSSEETPCWALLTFGCLYLWKIQPINLLSPFPHLARVQSWQPGYINHCTPGKWHHWQGYLSEDREILGLTEINRVSLTSILCANSVFITSWQWRARLLRFLFIFIFSFIVFGCSFIPWHVHFDIISVCCTGQAKG